MRVKHLHRSCVCIVATPVVCMLVLVMMTKRTFNCAEANSAVQQFWRHLSKARVQGNFLQLVEGTHFLGIERLGNTLMVRKSYVDLHGIILNRQQLGDGVMIITGSPGQLTYVVCVHLIDALNVAFLCHVLTCRHVEAVPNRACLRSVVATGFADSCSVKQLWQLFDTTDVTCCLQGMVLSLEGSSPCSCPSACALAHVL